MGQRVNRLRVLGFAARMIASIIGSGRHRWRTRLVAGAAAMMAATAMTVSSVSAQAIGTAVAVLPQATGQIEGQEVTLVAGIDLFVGETITTDVNGEVQIIFADDTRMVVGPNSSLVIETYLLRDPTTVSDLVVNALGGTFRFISGNSPSDAYTINTPTGTIGIRGTEFDFLVDWLTGLVEVIVYFGSVYLCPDDGPCVYLDARCSIGTISNAEADIVRAEGMRFTLADGFRYADTQFTLEEPFRVTDPRECQDWLDPNTPEEPIRVPDPDPGSSEPESSEPDPGSSEPESSEPEPEPVQGCFSPTWDVGEYCCIGQGPAVCGIPDCDEGGYCVLGGQDWCIGEYCGSEGSEGSYPCESESCECYDSSCSESEGSESSGSDSSGYLDCTGPSWEPGDYCCVEADSEPACGVPYPIEGIEYCIGGTCFVPYWEIVRTGPSTPATTAGRDAVHALYVALIDGF